MSIITTRRLEWDAGHRIWGHENKCGNLHGHRYVAEVSVTAAKLDNLCRIIDFSVIKKEIGSWIDTYWDHNFLLNDEDPLAMFWFDRAPLSTQIFNGRAPFIFPHGQNPTAEAIARHLGRISQVLLQDHHIDVVSVKVYETPNCSSLWEAGNHVECPT